MSYLDEYEPTFSIVRFYAPHTGKEQEVIAEGLTRKEAQEHCSDPDTRCDEYFDGFREE